VQPVSAAHAFDPVIYLGFARRFASTPFQTLHLSLHYEQLHYIFLCIFRSCSPDVLELFMITISLPFDLISSLLLPFFRDIINSFSDK